MDSLFSEHRIHGEFGQSSQLIQSSQCALAKRTLPGRTPKAVSTPIHILGTGVDILPAQMGPTGRAPARFSPVVRARSRLLILIVALQLSRAGKG